MMNGRVMGLYQQFFQQLANRRQIKKEYQDRRKAFNVAQAAKSNELAGKRHSPHLKSLILI
jgi:hypothetical protein